MARHRAMLDSLQQANIRTRLMSRRLTPGFKFNEEMAGAVRIEIDRATVLGRAKFFLSSFSLFPFPFFPGGVGFGKDCFSRRHVARSDLDPHRHPRISNR